MTDIVKEDKVLISNKNFGAYAITLRKPMVNCPPSLKASLMDIASKHDVKFLISEITEVS